MAKKIIIYNVNSYFGGPLVLSALCKTLRELGYDARVLFNYAFNVEPQQKKDYERETKDYLLRQCISYYVHKLFKRIHFKDNYLLKESPLTKMPGIKIQRNPFFCRKNTIVIYPEYLYGNPLGAKYVVRWLLYHYKFENVPEAYGKDDLFVCYRQIFNSPKLNPFGLELKINYFDRQLYRQYNFGPRSGKCYILRKGRNRKDLPKSFDGPVFDNNMTQEEVVKMFNEHEYCYSYDTQTFYTTVAAVCGCKPIVVMEPGKTVEDYLGNNEQVHYGVAYGDSPEQIEYAVKTREKRIASLDYSKSNQDSVKAFVEILENKFGKLKKT